MKNVSFGSPPPPPPPQPGRTISTGQWPQMLAAGKYSELCEQFIMTFDAIGRSVPFPRNAAATAEIDRILGHFFSAMLTPAFTIPARLAEGFVRLNGPIAALAAISSFGNTDRILRQLEPKAENFLKIMALYSARNGVSFGRESIFGTNGPVASLWYMRFAESYRRSLASPAIDARLREHFAFVPMMVAVALDMHAVYVGPSFVDPNLEEAAETADEPGGAGVLCGGIAANARPGSAADCGGFGSVESATQGAPDSSWPVFPAQAAVSPFVFAPGAACGAGFVAVR